MHLADSLEAEPLQDRAGHGAALGDERGGAVASSFHPPRVEHSAIRAATAGTRQGGAAVEQEPVFGRCGGAGSNDFSVEPGRVHHVDCLTPPLRELLDCLRDLVLGHVERLPLDGIRSGVFLECLDAPRDDSGRRWRRLLREHECDCIRFLVANETALEQAVDEIRRLRRAADLPLCSVPSALPEE